MKRTSKLTKSLAVCVIAIGAIISFAWSLQQSHGADRDKSPKIIGDLEADATNDVMATDRYTAALSELLRQEKFDELDRIADEARSRKERFSGGAWKLFNFYRLSKPASADKKDISDAVWLEHLDRLKRWVALKPSSVTARIALAQAYIHYAWKARGSGLADTVTEEGGQLFNERIELARRVLDDASTLPAKCPQWYAVMMEVATCQSWDRKRTRALLEQAIAFEPLYDYTYRNYALYLLPKWGGEPGETEAFVQEIASRIGGKPGAAVFFDVSANVFCGPCGEKPSQGFDHAWWDEFRHGYAASQELYGFSINKQNQFASLAVKANEGQAAYKAFERIGENWDESVWIKKSVFDDSKKWAAQFGPPPIHPPMPNAQPAPKGIQEIDASVDDSMGTSAGINYSAEAQMSFLTRHREAFSACLRSTRPDTDRSFDVYLQISDRGSVQQAAVWPQHALSNCLLPSVKSGVYNPPPSPNYWVRFSFRLPPTGARPSPPSQAEGR